MSREPVAPPRWAERLLAALLPPPYRDDQLGDLAEGFARRSEEPRAARRWYRRQVLRSIPGALVLRLRAFVDRPTESGQLMDTLAQDARFALRSLRKSPGFAVVATVTLALAIGVNTSIFSLVSAIVFADLPMRDLETATVVRGVNPELGIDQGSVSPADYLDLVERSRSFASLSALSSEQWVLTGGDRPERISGVRMTVGTTETWRLPPVLGRSFSEDEAVPGAEPVVMLTHGFWQDRFDGRPDVLGRSLTLDGREHTVIGVMHPDFEFASFRQAQVVAPLRIERGEAERGAHVLFVTGRLAPGVTQDMATREVGRIGEELAREHPEANAGWGLWSAPVMESLMDDQGRRMMILLQLTVAMVILIACANVANMLLARATARAREMAVRTALGAGRSRLIRQLLTESLLVSVLAAVLGFGFAYGLNEALIRISAGTEEVFLMAEMDGRVLAFTLVVSLVAPMAFGLFPALRASGVEASGVLREGRSGDAGRSGKRARGVLVTAQVALALTLMIVATLLARSVINLNRSPLGYDPSDILTARIDLPESGYDSPEATRRFFRRAREELAGLPGFADVELASALPGVTSGASRAVEIEGRNLAREGAAPSVRFTVVSPGFFQSVGLSLASRPRGAEAPRGGAGRTFTESDGAGSPRVVVVSREVAERFFTDEDPVGRRMRVVDSGEWLRVVGVVEDVRSPTDARRSALNVYMPFDQDPRRGMYLVGSTSTEATVAAGVVREALWRIDPDLPLGPVQTLERANYEQMASTFALVTLFVVFAVFALLMAAVGIYGVMAYSVSRRKGELGVRMALGARSSSVAWMVLRQGGGMLAWGVATGLIVAFVVSRLLAGFVFGISTTDPLTFVGVPVLLTVVALAANLVPVHRATRTDPATTLREG